MRQGSLFDMGARATHPNSFESWRAGLDDGTFSKRALAVVKAVFAIGPCTDRQIKEHLGMSDMNAVRPRVTELVKLGLLVECGSVTDASTRKTVRQVRLGQIPLAGDLFEGMEAPT